MKMDSYSITNSKVYLKLYKNVDNAKELREKLMKGSLNCCMIKPSLVYDPFQIVVAANKAVTNNKTTTKSVYTEILFNLSISKNISRSLQTFGIGENDENLLVVVTHKLDEIIDVNHIFAQVSGEEVPMDMLKDMREISLIKKVYKINDKECKNIPIIDSIVSRIATKDFLSH